MKRMRRSAPRRHSAMGNRQTRRDLPGNGGTLSGREAEVGHAGAAGRRRTGGIGPAAGRRMRGHVGGFPGDAGLSLQPGRRGIGPSIANGRRRHRRQHCGPGEAVGDTVREHGGDQQKDDSTFPHGRLLSHAGMKAALTLRSNMRDRGTARCPRSSSCCGRGASRCLPRRAATQEAGRARHVPGLLKAFRSPAG